MQRNVGLLDSWIRVTGGLILLSLGAAGRLGKTGSGMGVVLGACTVAEGISRYSPFYDLLGLSTVQEAEMSRLALLRARGREGVARAAESTPAVSRRPPWDRVRKESMPRRP